MNKAKGKNKFTLPPHIKIAVVDDHNLFRAGLMALLKDYDELRVIIEAADGLDLLSQLKTKQPHVVLLDIEMKGMNGIETTRVLKEKFPAIKIIVLSMHQEDEFIFELISKGAHGFIPKDKTVDEVVDAIYSVMEKGRYYNERILNAMVSGSRGLVNNMHLPLSKLTDKETEVLKHICNQKTNKEIAHLLGIGTRTVESHRNSILHKTGTKNTAGLVIYALKHKLVSAFDLN
ncbi:MAG: response regulator transcription factor [Bacteroidia bacterium]|nr:response regulator transcription factor [Bacteroidia bacterium]